MTSDLRRFVAALSAEGLRLLLQHLNIPEGAFEGLGRRERTKQMVDYLLRSPVDTRGRAEAIAGSVTTLAQKGDLAERALREVSQEWPQLYDILESDRSLEERIFAVWDKDVKALDRARNLANAHFWRDGKFHCAFEVMNPGPLTGDVELAKEAIGRIVQDAQGGRKAHLDHFTYAPEDGSGATVHHIAVYLETPASFLLEFREGENYPQPVLRREAREVAIDYDPRSGRVDVAGKGIGGFKTFERLAKRFCSTVLNKAELTRVVRPEWNLAPFIRGVPINLSPPRGFSSLRVAELVLISASEAGRRLTVRAGRGEDAHHYMRAIGLRPEELTDQIIHSVTIALTAMPRSVTEEIREVKVILNWPNARSFDGATLADQTAIELWLNGPPFV